MAEASDTEAVELDENGEPKRNFRRVLEDRATDAEAQVAELQAKLQGLERVDAFRTAGIDPDDTRQSYFVKGYDGEVDAESIRTAAMEAGFLKDNSGIEQTVGETPPMMSEAFDPEQVGTFKEELETQQRIAEAGVQGQPVVQPDLNDLIRATTDAEELKTLLRSKGIEVDVQG